MAAALMAAVSRSSLTGLISGAHVLALLDQGVLSVASFLGALLVGRFALPSELGIYSIGLSILASVLCIQESLISIPYAVQRHKAPSMAGRLAGAALQLSGMLSAIVVITLIIGAVGAFALGASLGLTQLLAIMVVAAPFVLLREFERQFAFAHLHLRQALALDVAAVAVQIAALSWLAWSGRMTAVAACFAVGAASGLAAVIWLHVSRKQFAIHSVDVRPTARKNWSLGQGLFATQLIGSAQSLGIYSLLASLGGTHAAGLYTACMSVALVANPVILGLSNLLTPKFALAWAEGGHERLMHESTREALLLGLVVAVFCFAISSPGIDFVHFLYRGQDYANHTQTVTVLSIGMLAMAIGMPATNALTSMGRGLAIFWTAAMATAITLVLVWQLERHFGLTGAAYGILVGNIVRTGARWTIFIMAREPGGFSRRLQELDFESR
jgi:O-antigen/teichoic acid export membrane protein